MKINYSLFFLHLLICIYFRGYSSIWWANRKIGHALPSYDLMYFKTQTGFTCFCFFNVNKKNITLMYIILSNFKVITSLIKCFIFLTRSAQGILSHLTWQANAYIARRAGQAVSTYTGPLWQENANTPQMLSGQKIKSTTNKVGKLSK